MLLKVMGGVVAVAAGLEDGGGVVEVSVAGAVEAGGVEGGVDVATDVTGVVAVVAATDVFVSLQPDSAREARAAPPMTIPASLRNSLRDILSGPLGFVLDISASF